MSLHEIGKGDWRRFVRDWIPPPWVSIRKLNERPLRRRRSFVRTPYSAGRIPLICRNNQLEQADSPRSIRDGRNSVGLQPSCHFAGEELPQL